MEDNMKVAKMKPWGISSELGLRAGVHRNTKVYIEPSNSDCIAPNNAIFSSDYIWEELLEKPHKYITKQNKVIQFVICLLENLQTTQKSWIRL